MIRFAALGFVASATTLSLTGSVAAADSNDDAMQQIEELRRQNEALAAKVAKLEEVATDEGAWLTEARATEIRGLVTDVLADAEGRTSLQGDGATAGWNKGFFLASPDGAFRLNIKGQIQFRWAYNARDIPDGPLASGSPSGKEDNWGFENRRAKLTFAGHIIDPSLTYEFQTAYSRSYGSNSSNANATIENVWVQKAFDGGWSIRAGQFKSPFLREELVSASAQLAVERSLVNSIFTTHYTQGLQLALEQDIWKIQGFYGDSLRAGAVNVVNNAAAAGGFNGSYNTDFQTNPANYAFAGRAELKLAGEWKQFRDFTSFRGEEFGLLLGVSGMAQNLRGVTNPRNASSMWGASADVTVDFGGANLFAYGVYRGVTLGSDNAVRGGGTNDDLDQWGIVVQGGVFVTDDVEVFARYELGNTDTDQYRTTANSLSADMEDLSVVTVGFNWYPMGFKSKELKWSTDFGYGIQPVGDFSSSGANWNADATGSGDNTEDGQFVIRSQIQLLF